MIIDQIANGLKI